jgi:threonine/homoserine/homoserine lactone efflux protein
MDLWAVAVFWFIMAITPGPNNILLTHSGLTFGLQRTLPLIVGVQLGVLTQNLAVAAGLGALFASQPWLHWVLRVAGTLYVLWLAYHSLRAAEAEQRTAASPVSWWAAAGFQYANPKSWVAAIASATAFVDGSESVGLQIVLVALTAAVVGTPCNLLWAVFGVALRRWISRPVVMRTVGIVLALMLVGTAVFFWIPTE